MSWTDERIETLKKMWDSGLTATQIAEELGGVSRNAVIGKAHRLGLESRPSPVKGNEASAPAESPTPRSTKLTYSRLMFSPRSSNWRPITAICLT